jgi:pyruvate formate lyase activating enzyme
VSLADYPGKISSIIFTHGCNLRCRYCHNPELVIMRKGINRYEDFLNYLKGKDIEGVVITGGEPLFSKKINELIELIKSIGLSIKLDTNGTSPSKLKKAIETGDIDYVALDIKAFNDEDYRHITRSNFSLKQFYECLDIVRQYGIDHELRHTMWKNPSDSNIKDFASHCKGENIFIQKASKENGTLDKRFTPEADTDAEKLKKLFMDYGLNASVR